MKNIWNTYKSSVILLGSMVLGGVIGLFWGKGAKILQPVADIFLNLLYCCVVPLIFCSLTSAIAKMENLVKLRKILITFLIGTILTGVISCLFMVAAALMFDPAKGAVLDLAEKVEDVNGSMNFLGMFTVKDFPLLFSKSNLMALIVFTVMFSIAIIMAGEKGKPVLKLMEALSDIIVNVIGIVMKIAPIGLGCYFAILIGEYGDQVIGPLSRAIIIYCAVIIVYFVLSQSIMAYIGAGTAGVKRWWKTALAPTLTALGTCSSAATLPLNMIQGKQLGIPDDIADITIPLGANLHKDGACIIQILKIAFLCSIFGIPYATPRNIIMSIVVAVVASVVMGGIPAGGYVAEIFIISAFGFPTVAIPVMVLIGTITDAPATVVNVTGDTGLAMVIARIVDGKDWMKKAIAEGVINE
ncbi:MULTISPECIES: dicarboxylate/amino acid:cation symporter [Clostridia]|uniref:Sodium:dicarboxylate symporter n=1 Tax=Lacrimispora celerecrescens TaxID=29354 RepID=A0A084JL90_9FIRM|nr:MULTISPECIES: dicarboxylate/amino acid:cation symporter [Clostridia]KEZ89724.1 sodium:dicarboxylate symporter [Lacrimispora celerecrescens]MSS07185.1 dicarboxylate/amino acid:cation symporter [Clostridium sp. WB02_MRS01]